MSTKPKKSRNSHAVEVSLFSWGDNSAAQLGIGESPASADVPARLPNEGACAGGGGVRAVCGGERHSLLLRHDGCVLSCGDNEFCQMGSGVCGGAVAGRFSQVTPLESKRVVCVAAGGWHSLAVDEEGQAFSWGRNHKGQLGRDGDKGGGGGVRLIRQLTGHQVAQVAAGQSHSLVLTVQHAMFAFGDNSRGQLGQGHHREATGCLPVTSLVGLPIGRVACGGQHCLALSHSGVLFGWGANSAGQLGCGSTEDQHWPVQCRNLRGQQIRHVTCGHEHSAALTADGGVFTFGAGHSGQLGHGQLTNEVLPRRVADLMGTPVTQLACGRAHTLALVPSTGRIYGFGLASAGQLGIGQQQQLKHRPSACIVLGPWVPASGTVQYLADSGKIAGDKRTPLVVYAFGDASFLKASAASPTEQPQPDDFRLARPSWLAASAEPLRLDACVQSLGKDASSSSVEMLRRLASAASTLASYNCAFLKVSGGGDATKSGVAQEQLGFVAASRQNHGVDLDAAAERLDRLGREIGKEAEDQLLAGLLTLLGELRHRGNYPDIECLRFFLVAPFLHVFGRPDLYEHLHTDYAQCVARLEPVPAKIVSHWLTLLPSRHYARLVRTFQAVARHVLLLPAHTTRMEALAKERGLDSCMRLLKLLHDVNSDRGDAALSRGNFYLTELNSKVDIARDYMLWMQKRGQTDHFSFCDFPFVFDGVAKTQLLRADAQLKMQQAVHQAQTQNFMSAMSMYPGGVGLVNPQLLLQVRRNNIVGDAISHLSKFPPEELRKPLRVKFVGEDAEDEGGVSKEFFQLIFREILNPLYGMFRSYDSRLIWFNFGSLEDASLFHLIGILCGLAIYNSFLAGVAFPLALYKKLLDRAPSLEDLRELDPTVGRSLQKLLEFESAEDVDALMLTFEIEVDYYGDLRRMPLSDSQDEPVTIENRQRYIDAYVNFIFNAGCSDTYAAFHDGFHKVCGGHVLRMFEPAELQAMLVGEADNFHWEELQAHAEYLGVYFAKHEVIVNFWSVFHRDLSEGQKRKFLHFLTGCDRVPMQGMSAIKIRFQPVHGGANYLPVAHTCYNLLDLPIYPDRESLKIKLTQAIEQTEGFALV